MLKNNRGITLIALIVTVIIMAIIAGAGISLIFRNEGIIESAKAVVNEYVASAEGEQEQLGILENKLAEFTSNSNNNVQSLEIGDTVNFSTTLNNVTLDSWKVFYVDGDYTYLILSDYLPNSAISSAVKTNNNLANGDGSYSIKSTTNRTDLINALSTTSNWQEIINNGEINGTALSLDVKSNANVWAKGSPDLELWVNSWNAKYPSDTLYTATTTSAMSDGLNGYYIGTAENPTTKSIGLSSKEGYSNTLYYPHTSTEDSCYGYWLASPSASYPNYVLYVGYYGGVFTSTYNYTNYAGRPVVCLPSNILN